MPLELYHHPLASYCWKVLIALYESGTAFDPRIVDLMNPAERAEFLKIAPLGKFPVIRDAARGQTVVESSIIIEYLQDHYPGGAALVPRDRERARAARYWDRFFDSYLHDPMQKVVGDRLRPEAHRDPYGVQRAKADLEVAYGVIDGAMFDRTWAIGDDFTIADCAAAPALYYANRVQPLGDSHAVTSTYLARLLARPSVARVIVEAGPYFSLFPE